MNKKLLFTTMLLGSMFIACTDDDSKPASIDVAPTHMILLSKEESAVCNVSNEFAFRLFDNVRNTDEHNLFFSPISAEMALAMLANGADGDTRQELSDVFGEGLNMDDVNGFNRLLVEELPLVDTRSTVKLANSIWMAKGTMAKPSFVDMCKNNYFAEVNSVDFSSKSALDAINAWASDNTNGAIPSLIQYIPEDVKIVIANATYFKAKWSLPFDRKDTKPAVFHNEDNTESTVQMMSSREDMNCFGNEKYVACEKDYGNKGYSIVLVLPAEGVGLDEVIGHFASKELDMHENAILSDVSLKLPKFELDSEIDLIPSLKSMGVTKIFDESANLSNLSDAELFVSLIKQKANVKVDEDGTVASSSTYIYGALGDNLGPQKKMELTFDRPFFFYIKEYSTNAVLFIGKVGKL